MPTLLVVSLHSLRDPLFSTLILEYLRGVRSARPDYTFVVTTEEQPPYSMSREEADRAAEELRLEGIRWRPLPYRHGRFILARKLLSVLQLLWTCLKETLTSKPIGILGFLAPAGAYSYLVSRVLNLPLLVFCFEPHSQYMVDFQRWSVGSLKFRLLATLERLSATRSEVVVVPTTHTEALVASWHPRGVVERSPICIRTTEFVFSETERRRVRAALGIEGRYVLLYLGKLGGAYYGAAALGGFCRQIGLDLPEAYFLVVTPSDDVTSVTAAFLAAGLTERDFLVRPEVEPTQVAGIVSAADMGMLAIPPLPAQRYRTPVKTAIYLSCGLPVLLHEGVGDDDALVREERVGIALGADPARALHDGIRHYMNEDRSLLRQRCRQAAIKHRDVALAVAVLGRALTRLER